MEIEARDLRKEPHEPRQARFEREPEPPRFEREPEPPRFEREHEPPVTFEPELEYEYDPAPEYESEDALDDEAYDEPDTAEMDAVTVAAEPVQHELEGVTPSADWGWDDPEDFSAPV
jgi:hypothetical protein